MAINSNYRLPQYEDEIIQAKERMKGENLIPPRDYKGIRIKEKIVEEMYKDKEKARERATETDNSKERAKA